MLTMLPLSEVFDSGIPISLGSHGETERCELQNSISSLQQNLPALIRIPISPCRPRVSEIKVVQYATTSVHTPNLSDIPNRKIRKRRADGPDYPTSSSLQHYLAFPFFAVTDQRPAYLTGQLTYTYPICAYISCRSRKAWFGGDVKACLDF